ncbi:MAG: DUF1028 domain-containing protein [Phycisphaeraceae bacterium]|nr:DUF1028 domain-containing protein [Phycisphaeraceae bacterium]
MPAKCSRLVSLIVAAWAALATSISATWSIILIDLRTGEIAVGSATCLTNFDMRTSTPVLITGVGGATAQSFVDQTGLNRARIRDGFLQGETPAQILAALAIQDSGHQTRQYGFADVLGNTGTFSGSGAGPWAGGRVGRFAYTHAGVTGEIAYAIQGNVLAGPAVVDHALDAAMNTQGDLPERLMAAMQAARLIGGDGRCSCRTGGPACGTPPPGFDPDTDKSSHIGYMFIARAGDVDGCTGLYGIVDPLFGIALKDLNGDGLPDAVVSGASGIYVLINTTPPGSALATFAPPVLVAPTTAQSRRIGIADVTGNGHDDLVVLVSQISQIHIHPGLGGGAFAPPMIFATGGSPLLLNFADLNGDGVLDPYTATGNGATVVMLLSDGLGGHVRHEITLPASAQGVDAFDANGDGHLDLVVAYQALDQMQLLLNDGAANFSFGALIDTGDEPIDVLAIDFDLDSDIDLLTADRAGQTLSIFKREHDAFVRTTLPLPRRPRLLRAADINGDGLPDLVVQNVATDGMTVLTNTGTGFVVTQLLLGAPATDLALADLNADGLADIVAPGGASPMAVNTNSGDARRFFAPIIGCAAGDYFMGFNIAHQSAATPDPVVQMQVQFDQWRIDLLGRPDAVLSTATSDDADLAADGNARGAVHVQLQDWNMQPVTAPVTFSLRSARNAAAQGSLGEVTSLGQGAYTLELIAGTRPGLNRFELVVDDGHRPVTLMPGLGIRFKDARADFNGDGRVNALDIPAFLDAFIARETRADLTHSSHPTDPGYGTPDGVLDAADLFYLLDLIVQ